MSANTSLSLPLFFRLTFHCPSSSCHSSPDTLVLNLMSLFRFHLSQIPFM